MAAKKKTSVKGVKKKKPVRTAKKATRKATAKKPPKKVKSAQKKAKPAKKKAVAAPKKKSVKTASAKKRPINKKAVKKTLKKVKKAKKPIAKPAAQKKKVGKKSAKAVSKKTKPAKKSAKSKKPAPTLPVPPSHFSVRGAPLPRRKKKPEKKLTAKELREFKQLLLNLRDQVVDGISFLSGDNLNRSQRDASGDLSGYSLHMADQGTDNYDREFALNLVSTEQDLLYEIDEALGRIENKKYGICEMTGDPIERARLKAVPYARFCLDAQSEMERGRTRYRPFGATLSHGG